MANRYLVATGNWNDTAVWSTTSGGAGGASVPTASDYVYLNSNNTVTVNVDAECMWLQHTNGTFNLGSNSLTSELLISSGTTARTINLQNGHLIINSPGDPCISFTGSNLTFDAGNSLVTINSNGSYLVFDTASKSFNDVRINLGFGSTSIDFYITGSPTFRLLDIRSVNSAAHTVKFDADFGNTDCAKFICIGSSPTNRITLADSDMSSHNFCISDSFYAQNIDAQVYMPDSGSRVVGQRYAGTGSLNSNGQLTLQDPPKISTLIDPLTTTPASNTNWTTTGTVTQISTGLDGGGYLINSSSSLVSTDTFDLVDSEIIFERVPNQVFGRFGVDGVGGLVNSPNSVGAWEQFNVHPVFGGYSMAYYSFPPVLKLLKQNGRFIKANGKVLNYETGGSGTQLFQYPISSSKFLKIKISSGNLIMQYSDDGVAWTTGYTQSIPASDLDLFRSTRIIAVDGTQRLGSIGMLPTV